MRRVRSNKIYMKTLIFFGKSIACRTQASTPGNGINGEPSGNRRENEASDPLRSFGAAARGKPAPYRIINCLTTSSSRTTITQPAVLQLTACLMRDFNLQPSRKHPSLPKKLQIQIGLRQTICRYLINDWQLHG